MGSVGRVLRIAAGAVLIGLAATNAVGAWGYMGVLPLVTGLFHFCPAYSLLGLSTCPASGR
ncbi:YgaP family membrane protein [Ideonella sp. YS5]|uniref:YgaP family membrane protein n=1 Tax=Ideonella sp. YS5 TaxID=3453714 RepID=UPI003EEBF2FD